MIIIIEQPRKVLQLLQIYCSVLKHNPNPMQMSQHGEGMRELLPSIGEMQEPSVRGNCSTPLPPGMGGVFRLPIFVENCAIATAPDVPDLTLTPRTLSQDNLAMGAHHTTSPNGDIGTLGVVVLFQPDPMAQGTEGRLGIAPGHATLGDIQTDNFEGIRLGTQVTVPTEDANINAPPT
jgi:hypothetical protein